MLTWIVNRQLDPLERRLGTSVDYLRHLTRTSKSAFFKLMGFVPMAAHHGGTPRRLLFAARFLATHREDCGTCVQIVVNQAIRERVNFKIIQALIDDDPSGLDQETRLVVAFTRAVLDNTDDQEHLRDELRTCLGDRAIVDLAVAIASARVFPMLKRSLGYAVSCQKVNLKITQLAGTDVS